MAEAVNSAARPPWAYESMPVKKNFNLLVRRRGGGGKTLSKMQHEASTSCESPDALLTWQHSCGNEGDIPSLLGLNAAADVALPFYCWALASTGTEEKTSR